MEPGALADGEETPAGGMHKADEGAEAFRGTVRYRYIFSSIS